MTGLSLFSYFNRTILPFYSLLSIPHFVTSFAIISLSSDAKIDLNELIITIIIGFTARFLAMSANRLIDREIDKKNPRTQDRPSATGQLSTKKLLTAIYLSTGAYLGLSLYLSFQIFLFAFLLLTLLIGYSYCKRFTIYRHFVLGGVYGLIPLAINLVLHTVPTLNTLWLSIAFACSIIARDLLYAIQDINFYKKERLFSIPAKWGEKKTMGLAFVLHLSCLGALSLIFYNLNFFAIFTFFLIPLTLSVLSQYLLIIKFGIKHSVEYLFYTDIINNSSVSLLAGMLYYSHLSS